MREENIGTQPENEEEQSPDTVNGEQQDAPENRRQHIRSVFTYPVEFKIFSQNAENAPFKGYLRDISATGACLEFTDRYGRFNADPAGGVRLKLVFALSQGDKVTIFALIRWMKRVDPRSFSVKMGIEFTDMESWQLQAIQDLISMRNKDHNMMWNLWEQYENQNGR